MRISELWRYPVKSMAGERLDERACSASTASRATGGSTSSTTRRRDPLGAHQAAAARPSRHDRARRRGAGRRAPVAQPGGRSRRRGRRRPGRAARRGRGQRALRHPAAARRDRRRHRGLRPRPAPAAAERRRSGASTASPSGEWQWRLLAAGDAVIALADLRERCIMTTWDPDSLEQDVDVLRRIRADFDGTLALNAWAGREGWSPSGRRARARRSARAGDARAGPLRVNSGCRPQPGCSASSTRGACEDE